MTMPGKVGIPVPLRANKEDWKRAVELGQIANSGPEYNKNLQTLQRAAEDSQAKMKDLRLEKAAVTEREKEVTKREADLADLEGRIEADRVGMNSVFNEREAKLKMGFEELQRLSAKVYEEGTAKKDELAQAEKELAERERSLKAKEDEAAARASRASQAQAAADETKRVYEQKLVQLKGVIG